MFRKLQLDVQVHCTAIQNQQPLGLPSQPGLPGLGMSVTEVGPLTLNTAVPCVYLISCLFVDRMSTLQREVPSSETDLPTSLSTVKGKSVSGQEPQQSSPLWSYSLS